MPNDSATRYFDAAIYACQVLGDDAARRYFERLQKLAKTNSLDELKSIIDGWRVSETSKTLETGAKFRVPEGMFTSTVVDDAVQQGWVALLESGKTSDKEANIAGQTAARDIVREEQRYVPFPEVTLEDGSKVTVDPRDIEDPRAGRTTRNWEELWDGFKRQRQIRLLRELSDEDWNSLMQYLAGVGLGRAARKDINHAASIKRKLRRKLASEPI